MLRSVRPSVRLSVCPIPLLQNLCILRLWLLEVEPLISVAVRPLEVWKNGKPWPTPPEKHSPGGRTVDIPPVKLLSPGHIVSPRDALFLLRKSVSI